MSELEWNPGIVLALLSGKDVEEAKRAILKKREDDLTELDNKLKIQVKNAKLIILGENMPEGSPGKKVADAILEEMRQNFPEEATEADERISTRKDMEDQLNRIAGKERNIERK